MRRANCLVAVVLLACKSSNPTPTEVHVAGNAGLGAQVEVLYDSQGVPHVYAHSDADAAYALGYLQARDRLFEMDFFRRFARGRLAEVLGLQAVGIDETQRALFTSTQHTASGSYRIEDVILERLPVDAPESLTWTQRYADGVNRFLQDLAAGANGSRLPLEYLLASIGPGQIAPWTAQDSLAIGRLQTFLLSSTLQQEIAYARVAQGLAVNLPGQGILADLTRFAPAVNSFVLPASPVVAGGALAPLARAPVQAPASSLAGAASALAHLPRVFGRERAGSNNWVAAPPLTAGGHALVANDPHLSLMRPANFHLTHLVTPTRDVAGVAFAGTPVIVIGHNDRIGWGATVAEYDVTDVYVEAVSGGQIVVPQGAPGPVVVHETVGVKEGSPVSLDVILVPNHGPVVPGSMTGTSALTMKWTGQTPTYEAQAFLDLNRARSVDEAFTALERFQVGAQNFVVADVTGHIGYDPHARVPIRPPGCIPWAPMAGDGTCEWQGDVPDGQLPQLKDPPQNFIATANNDITGYTADNNPLNDPQYLYATTDLGYRHRRIVERLTAKSSHTLDDMTSIQADTTSALARAIVPGLVSLLDSQPSSVSAKGLGAAVDLLRHWGDGASSPSDPGPWTTPTGLTGSSPLSSPSSDAGIAARSGAAMLFHAVIPRFARAVLDDDLAHYTAVGDSAPLSVNGFLGKLGDQFLAKYLVALVGTANGQPQAVPLVTGTGLCAAPSGNALPCSAEAVQALDEAVKFLEQASIFDSALPSDWRWGRLHGVVFTSPLSLAGVPFFDDGPYANDGGLYTVDVANFDWTEDGSPGGTELFIQHDGPNVRFSAELADGHVRWRAVIPGGQVDYSGDPHDRDQVPAWLANQPGDQPYLRSEVEAQMRSRLFFDP